MSQPTPATLPAFVVDKKGLAKLLERKGKDFAVVELVQNAWDEDTTQVDIMLERVEPLDDLWMLVVEDDNPEGFKDLAHAYTLFAESAKKGDATKRGRFNLGEKLVIAICETATIATTKGKIIFEGDERKMTAAKRKAGSVFTGFMRLSDPDVDAIKATIATLLPPHGIKTTFNFVDIPHREPLRAFEVSLRTELADDDGRLKPTTRKATVEIYQPLKGETAMIYEMGIPVVETGDRFHVNIGQKVPLPTDRDNVPPGYLRDVRVAVLNECHDLLRPEDAKASWVSNAMEDEKATPEAVKAAFSGKFGDKAVILDPNDTEANKIAAREGYTVVPGGALPKAAWDAVKTAKVALPAGQVTPSPQGYGDGEEIKLMDPAHWPEDVQNIAAFAKAFAARLLPELAGEISVRIANDSTWPFAATYGPKASKTGGELTLNLGRLGFAWFKSLSEAVIDLLLHEFGHHYHDDHLDRRYLNALTMLGARAVQVALEDPEFFAEYGANLKAAAA
ncbi:MAG: hypothetical protein ABW167_13270 [Baekduia sp.]